MDKTAFGYMRVSGKGQEEGDGFERQRLAITRHAEANGISIIDWFQDTQTGKDEWQFRPGWSNMAARLNGCRTVIVEKLDRVARAVLVQELILADLKKREVRLITSAGDDTFDDTPERVMYRGMLALFAQYERQSIVIKLRGARQRKKEEIGRCEGRKPYGENPKHPEEAAILQRIQAMRSAGETFDAIARTLNGEGVGSRGTKAGGPGVWIGPTIAKIVRRMA